jgi:hypothetical protein
VEKWILASLAIVLVVFAVVFIVGVSGGDQATARGCVDVSILGATGGAAIHQCGANARALCRDAGRPQGYSGETGREIAAACRKDGFAVG